MPAFEARGGMPYWVELRSNDLRKSKYFYSKLFGWEISQDRGDSPYLIARKEGLPVAGILPSGGSGPDTWVTSFLADDIEQAARDISTAGGRVYSDPVDGQLGTMLVAADNAGALFGLIEPVGEDSFVAAGEPGTPVWHEYSATSKFTDVIDFYHELFGWELVTMDNGEDYGYATALVDGAAFAGLRNAAGFFPPQVPSFWQTFLGVADANEAASMTEQLGGEVIRAPFDAEFGRLAILADSTGATLTVCEVDEPVNEDMLSETDDLFNL